MIHRYFIIYKPYLVLSQFSPQEGKQTLADFFNVPKDIYPVGRLDYDSEGLLILTNDKALNHRLLHPTFAHEREYWAQVDGNATIQAAHALQGSLVRVVPPRNDRLDPHIMPLGLVPHGWQVQPDQGAGASAGTRTPRGCGPQRCAVTMPVQQLLADMLVKRGIVNQRRGRVAVQVVQQLRGSPDCEVRARVAREPCVHAVDTGCGRECVTGRPRPHTLRVDEHGMC